jgi:hypothetical protein
MGTIPLKLWQKIYGTVNRLASIPAHLIWILLESALIEKNIFRPRYQKAISAHNVLFSSGLPTLEETEKEIVDALENNGIFMTSLEALNLPGTECFLESAIELGRKLENRASLPALLNHHEVHATLDEFMEYPELFYWGLHQELLKIVDRYLNLSVGYDGASCVMSVANGREIGARAWHRDREDRRMLKICVYLNDVDTDGGPFECLSPELNDWLSQSAQYRHKSIFDQEMQQLALNVSAQQKVTCTGLAGTVIFVDTARFFHRGKPPTLHNRTAIFFHYFSRRPSHPFFCHRTPFSQGNIASLTHQLSEEQRACVNWKENLPLIAKAIPRKRT